MNNPREKLLISQSNLVYVVYSVLEYTKLLSTLYELLGYL